MAGDPSDSARLVRMLRYIPLCKKQERLRVLLPQESQLIRVVEHSGREKKVKIIVYEKFLR